MELAKPRRAPMELLRQQQAPVEQQSHPSITDLRDMSMPKNGELTIFALAFFCSLLATVFELLSSSAQSKIDCLWLTMEFLVTFFGNVFNL
jgi:hypothetical protein